MTWLTNWYNFYGYSNSIYKPYLTVTYCSTPGTPTNLAATVTSTTTANLSWHTRDTTRKSNCKILLGSIYNRRSLCNMEIIQQVQMLQLLV